MTDQAMQEGHSNTLEGTVPLEEVLQAERVSFGELGHCHLAFSLGTIGKGRRSQGVTPRIACTQESPCI